MSGMEWAYVAVCLMAGAAVAVYVERETESAFIAGILGLAGVLLMPLVVIVALFGALARAVNRR